MRVDQRRIEETPNVKPQTSTGRGFLPVDVWSNYNPSWNAKALRRTVNRLFKPTTSIITAAARWIAWIDAKLDCTAAVTELKRLVWPTSGLVIEVIFEKDSGVSDLIRQPNGHMTDIRTSQRGL